MVKLRDALTAFYLQRAGLCVQREATQVHVAHGRDCDSVRTKVTPQPDLTSSFDLHLVEFSTNVNSIQKMSLCHWVKKRRQNAPTLITIGKANQFSTLIQRHDIIFWNEIMWKQC